MNNLNIQINDLEKQNESLNVQANSNREKILKLESQIESLQREIVAKNEEVFLRTKK